MIGIEIGAREELAHSEFIGVPPQVDTLALSKKLQRYFGVGRDAEVSRIPAPVPVSALELLVFHEVARDALAPAPDDVQAFPVGRVLIFLVGRELKPIDRGPAF